MQPVLNNVVTARIRAKVFACASQKDPHLGHESEELYRALLGERSDKRPHLGKY